MAQILSIILPLYAIIAVGWLAGRLGVMGTNAAQVLSRFVFLFAMPVAVFGFFASAPTPQGAILPMMAGYALAAIVVMILGGWIAKSRNKLSVPETGAHAFLSTCGNAIFLGLPIALSLDGWGQPFLMLMIVEGTLVYGGSLVLFQWAGDDASRRMLPVISSAITRTLRTPIMIGIFAGLAWSFAGLPLPATMDAFIDLFGGTAAPAGLFVVGLYIAALPRHDFSQFLDTILMAGIAKLAVLPGLTFLFTGIATGWNWPLVSVATFFTSLPPAVSAVVQASHFGIYERRAATALVTITPVSLITLIIVLALLAPA